MAIRNGGPNDDTLQGGSGDDILNGGGGDDSLIGDKGNDLLVGGKGNDFLSGWYGDDVLIGGSGNDYLSAVQGDAQLYGGSGNDTLQLSWQSNALLDGGSGIDTASVNTLGSQSERFEIDGDTATFSGGGVTTTFRDIEHYTVNTGTGDDTLIGTGAASVHFAADDGNNVLVGSAGDDTLIGGKDDDRLDGGAGDDQLYAGIGRNDVRGGDGNDVIGAVLAQQNTIDAGAGDDTLTLDYWFGTMRDLWTTRSPATSRADIALGAGDDRARLTLPGDGTAHTVTLDGGDGYDRVSIDLSHAAFDMTMTAGAPIDLGSAVHLRNVEQVDLRSGSGNDRVVGSGEADRLDAGTGRDVVEGGGGDDVLGIAIGGQADGGSGNDRIELHGGSAGVSFVFASTLQVDATTSFANMETLSFFGASGNDDVTGSSGGDLLADGAGNDVMRGGAGNDTFVRGVGQGDSGIDRLSGGAGHDSLSFATYLVGVYPGYSQPSWDEVVVLDLAHQERNAGEAAGLTLSSIETIEGTFNNDVLRGRSGAQTFVAGFGDDRLNGRGGDDRLDGGYGKDVLNGGSGKDTFVCGQDDTLLDFTRGVDKLEFKFDGEVELVVGKSPKASGSHVQLLFDTATHQLWIDYDGAHAGTATLVATLEHVSTLAQSDFVFV